MNYLQKCLLAVGCMAGTILGCSIPEGGDGDLDARENGGALPQPGASQEIPSFERANDWLLLGDGELSAVAHSSEGARAIEVSTAGVARLESLPFEVAEPPTRIGVDLRTADEEYS
ncbi:hypothetical protein ACSRUE_03670 [Sorangium sp. KYC3313]|uniref:hypothetical protein n=1 Tax=Sorangium sp. KYC3313 TaxID=3449740 RepID=UPI003F8BB1FA